MKPRFFPKLCVLLLLVPFLCSCEFGWKQYINEDNDFSILLPASWEKQEDVFDAALIVLAPVKGKNKNPPVRANMNIIVADLPARADLDIVFDFNRTELSSKLARIDDIIAGDIYAGPLLGRQVSFAGLLSGFQVKIISANWVKGRRVYTVTCTSALNEFPKYEKTFKKMFRTLRIK
ncbi:MAG: hypothetical protein WC532_08825 [Candidatus Omnitrophota bacterium]